MVDDGVLHGLDLVGGEELLDEGIISHEFGRDFFMVCSANKTAEIMKGGDGVDHVLVGRIISGEFKATFDDFVDMPDLVCPVVSSVEGEDVLLDVVFELTIHLSLL